MKGIALKLHQIATVSAGHPFRGRIPEIPGTGVVAVQMKDATPHTGIHWPGCVETEINGRRHPDWLQPGDILVAGRGSQNYAVLVSTELLQHNIRAVAAPHFYVINRIAPTLDPEYLAWLLNQGPCQRYFEQNAEGTLTKSIRRGILENTEIAVPAQARQQAIIGLARALRREQQIAEQLLRNGERLLNTIATDLLNQQDRTTTE